MHTGRRYADLHFDDYFYPAGAINDDAAYAADPRGFPATTAGRADWRRDNINLLIAGVNERIRAVKPWVKFGVSPSGIYRSSLDPAVGSPTSSGASQHYLGMPWKDTLAPAAPGALTASAGENAVVLSWAPAAEMRGEMEKLRRFAVYRSESREIDIEAAGNLVGVTEAATPAFADTKVQAGQYYYYAVTALNRLGNESAKSNLVSNDFEAPQVRTRDTSVTLANGSASIAPADIDGGTTDNWGVESLSASTTSFSCGDIGAKQVALTALDKAGLSATVLGYGAQSLSLTASDADFGTTFAWNPAAGLSSAGAAANFAPNGAGSFSFTAQAISENGCPAVASVTVPVIDARCGDGKVAVCRKPKNDQDQDVGNRGTVCVAPDAVPAFLRKGETLGSCSQ